MSGAETQLPAGVVVPELVDVIPKWSVLLDLDYTFPLAKTTTLRPDDLRDFIRDRWQHAQTTAKKIGKLLGVEDGKHGS
jgi:hypothetical protein